MELYKIKKMPLDEPFQHRIVTLRKARKTHTCSFCQRPILRGQQYCEITIGGGGLGSLKFPSRCHMLCVEDYLRDKKGGK